MGAISESLPYRCWSYLGDFQSGQAVSIGERCHYKAVVERKLLYALGFYHEQSRMDHDDYVQIWWDEIIEGTMWVWNDWESFIDACPLFFFYNAKMTLVENGCLHVDNWTII